MADLGRPNRARSHFNRRRAGGARNGRQAAQMRRPLPETSANMTDAASPRTLIVGNAKNLYRITTNQAAITALFRYMILTTEEERGLASRALG
jgi:hypothetical protein